MKRYFKLLPIEVLHSALGYQRPLNEEFIREKSKPEIFDVNEVDAPAISLRINNCKEEFRIIDGQHTISIVECVGWKHIKCEIREGLTDEQENEWFYKRNNKKRPQASGRMLNAKINGKFDPNTNVLVNVLNKVDYKIKTSAVKNGKGTIKAGLTLEKVFKDMGVDYFEKCITLHKTIWDGDKKSLIAPFLTGLKKFFITYGEEIESKRFVSAFKTKTKFISANDIIKDATSSVLKKSSDIKYAWVFAEYYNKGLVEQKRLKLSKLID